MNIKIEALKAVLFLVVGAFLYSRFQPKPSLSQPQVAQSQASDCQVVVKKTISKDGKVEETVSVVAKQQQEQKIEIPNVSNKNALLLGIATDKKASLGLQIGKYEHQVRTDFNKDHVYQFSYKVLEF